jgi:hypothetical protein
MQFKIECDSGQAQANTVSTAKFRLPAGFRYDSLLLTLVSVTGSLVGTNYVGDLLLKSNNSVQRAITPARLDALNGLNNPPSATYGLAAATPYTMIETANPGPAQLSMFFHEPWGAYDPYHRFALDVLDGDNFTLEVPIASAPTAPTVIITANGEPISDVLARGEKLNRVAAGKGTRPTLVKFLNGAFTPAGVSATLTKWKDNVTEMDTIQAIRFFDPTAAISIDSLNFKVGANNGTSWTDVLTKKQNGKLLRENGMNPTASPVAGGAFDLVPMLCGAPKEGWVFGANQRVNIDLVFSASASTEVQWITQAFGPTV